MNLNNILNNSGLLARNCLTTCPACGSDRLTDYPVGTNYRYIAIDQANNIRGYYHWPNDVGRNRNFTYDELDRLTGFLDGDVTNKRYQYDANGNRTSISFLGQTPFPYTIAANSNRLLGQTSPSVKSFSYDAAGNTISDGSSSLAWNAAGRLKTVTAGTNVNSYLYNGNGERLIKTGAFLSNAPHRFVYDGAGHLIGEYDSNNALREETLWLGDTPVAVIQRDPATGLNQTYYVHSDHLNTPKVLLNSANVPVWRSDNSDAFGAGLPVQDPDADGKAVEYNLRFPGQYYDTETGLHYNYFRDYNPSTGRYVQSDPIGLDGGVNTYGYVGGSPVNAVDPLGLKVYIKCRPAEIAYGIIDHCWVETDTKSGGMGADPSIPPGQQYEGIGMPVQINNHSKDKATKSTEMNNVDEQCVNDKLQIGKPIGRFFPPFNQCQSFAYGTVNSCRTGPQLSPQ